MWDSMWDSGFDCLSCDMFLAACAYLSRCLAVRLPNYGADLLYLHLLLFLHLHLCPCFRPFIGRAGLGPVALVLAAGKLVSVQANR